jgi:hypothetical protein
LIEDFAQDLKKNFKQEKLRFAANFAVLLMLQNRVGRF